MISTPGFRKCILWRSEILTFKPTVVHLLEYFSTYKELCSIPVSMFHPFMTNIFRMNNGVFLPHVQFSPCSIIQLIPSGYDARKPVYTLKALVHMMLFI